MGKDEPKKGKQLTSFLEELKAKHVTASDLSANERQVHVQVPPLKLKRVIDLLANYVAQMGEPFEEALKQRLAKSGESGDRGIDWTFLKEHSSPEAQYYRWRTFSFVQGDSRHHWRMEPFQMCTKGTVWHPPQRNRGDESDSSSSSRSRSRLSPGYRHQEDDFCAKWQLDRPARLLLRELPPELREQAMMKFNPYTEVKHADYSKVFAAWTRRFRASAKDEEHPPESNGRKRMGTERMRRRDLRDLERLLKDLSVHACDIRRAMVWCLDNDDMAIDVSRHLLDSLEEEDITAHERCLRLCLISDILHNAASIYKPTAVVYRREFETYLPAAFEHFHRLFKGVKDLSLVQRVLNSWIDRAIFTPKFIKGLEASMIKGIVSAEGGSKLPDSLLVKLAEWQSQHFSQLEKICKVQGLNWDVQLSEKAEAIGGRFPEELRKKWLLDRLLTYELYVLETRTVSTVSAIPLPKPQMDPFEAFDPELDGESLDSDDEAYVRRVEQKAEVGATGNARLD